MRNDSSGKAMHKRPLLWFRPNSQRTFSQAHSFPPALDTLTLVCVVVGLQKLEDIPTADISDPLSVLEILVQTYLKLPHLDAVIRNQLLGSVALFAHAVHVKGIPLPDKQRTEMIKNLSDTKDTMDAYDKALACEFDFQLECSIAALQLTEHTNTLAKQADTYAIDFLKLIASQAGLGPVPKAAAADFTDRMKDMWKSWRASWFREVMMMHMKNCALMID